MISQQRTTAIKGLALLLLALSAHSADASVIAVGPGAFPAGSTLITFTGLADGTEINGLSVAGVAFSYSLGNGALIIDGGPGITNNVNPPHIVSIGNPSGILTLILPGFFDIFGQGYAVLSTVAVINAATINLFSGATNVGSLSYNGALDPNFAGGFAGIQSTIPFNRVALTFNSVAAPAFALDNIRFASQIPEPSSMVLLLSGLAGLLWLKGRQSSLNR